MDNTINVKYELYLRHLHRILVDCTQLHGDYLKVPYNDPMESHALAYVVNELILLLKSAGDLIEHPDGKFELTVIGDESIRYVIIDECIATIDLQTGIWTQVDMRPEQPKKGRPRGTKNKTKAGDRA